MKDPLRDAMLIFTASSSDGRAAYVVDGKGYIIQTELVSAQIVGLQTVAVVFQFFADKAFNLYTDSHYIFKALQVIETVACNGTSNKLKCCFCKFKMPLIKEKCHAL